MRKFKFFKNESREFPWLVPYSWEQRRLEDIADIIGGGTPSTSIPSYWDGDIDWYAPAEMEGQIYAVKSVRRITEEGLKNSSARMLPAEKTILFTSRAGIGKMAILQRTAATNQGFQSIVLRDGISSYFIYSMGTIIKGKAEGIASGSTFLEISGKMLGSICISIPDVQEQKKIGVFFQSLDRLITLHQRKHFYVFPKTGAFHNEKTNAWEQRKLGEIANRHDNLRVPIAANLRVSGTTPYYGANGIQDYVSGYTHDGEFILVAEDGANDLKNYPVQYVCGQIWVNNHAHVLQAKEKIASNKFLKYAISQTNIEPFLVGGGRAKLNAETMMNIEVFSPLQLAEQQKIGSFFRSLDDLITLHQRKPLFLFLEELRC